MQHMTSCPSTWSGTCRGKGCQEVSYAANVGVLNSSLGPDRPIAACNIPESDTWRGDSALNTNQPATLVACVFAGDHAHLFPKQPMT